MRILLAVAMLALATPALAFTPEDYSARKADGVTATEKVDSNNFKVKLTNYNRHTGVKGSDLVHNYDLNDLKAKRTTLKAQHDAVDALIKDLELL